MNFRAKDTLMITNITTQNPTNSVSKLLRTLLIALLTLSMGVSGLSGANADAATSLAKINEGTAVLADFTAVAITGVDGDNIEIVKSDLAVVVSGLGRSLNEAEVQSSVDSSLSRISLQSALALESQLQSANYVDYSDVTDALALPEVTTQNKNDKATAITTAIAALVTQASQDALDDAKDAEAGLTAADYVDYSDVTDALALPEVTTQNKNDKATAITTAIAALKLITDPPSIISIELAPSTSVWYGIGDTDDLKIIFDEDIKIVGASPSITLESADFNLTLTYKSHDGAEMIVSYTLEEGVTPALLFGASYTLGNTSESLICDLQDNCITDPSALIPSEAIVDRDGPAIFSELSATWDVERPTITGLVLAPEFAEESYKIGDTVVLEVTFSEEVFVSSTPILTMGTNQEFDVVLTYRGSGETSDKILVDYIVQENVDLEDLRLAQYQEFVILNGFITDVAGNLPILAPDAGVLGGAVASLAGIDIYDVTKPFIDPVADSVLLPSYVATWEAPVFYAYGEDIAQAIVVYSSNDSGSGVSDLSTARTHLQTVGNSVRVTYTATDVAGNTQTEIATFTLVAAPVANDGGSQGPAGPAGPVGPAGPAGAAAPASTVNNQALALAIANAESATVLATEKAKALDTALDTAKVAAELAKTESLNAAELARTNSEKLTRELSLLAQKKNSITITRGTLTSRINLNLSDDHADSEGVVQMKKPGSKSFANVGNVILNESGNGFVKMKGIIKKGTSIRVLIDGAVVKSITIK
jgi:hypothetical protein